MNISRKLGNKDHYNPYSLEKYHTEKELRDEYRRYRDIARKRLDRLEKNDLLPRQSIDNWRNVISDKPKDLTKAELAHKLSQLDGFLDSPKSTVTGARQKQKDYIEIMNDRGYTFLDETNVKDFINFMNDTKEYRDSHVIGSDIVVDLIQQTTNAEIPIQEVKKNFDFYMQNLERIRKTLKKNDSKKFLSTGKLKKKLNAGKKNTSRKKLARQKKKGVKK